MTMQVPLRQVAEVRVSNVDKKTDEDERLVRLCNYTDVYYRDKITADLEFMIASATEQQIRAFELRAGDTIITKDSETAADIGIGAFVPHDLKGVVCGYHLAILRPQPKEIDPRYLSWATQSDFVRGQLEVKATGVTRYGLTYGAIRGLEIPVAADNVVEQRWIAEFLDDQVARIDRAIVLRARQIALLDAARVSAFDEVFGSAQATTRLSRLLRQSGVGVVVNPSSYFTDEGVPFLHGNNVRDGYFELRSVKFMTSQDSISLRRSRLQLGDVLVVRAGYPGRSAVVGPDIVGGNCASILVLRPDERVLPHYLSAFFNSSRGKGAISLVQYGAAQTQVNLQDVLAFELPIANIAVQGIEIRKLEEKLSESAGINRHGGGDGNALHRRSSDPRWPRVMRWRPARAQRSVDRGTRRPGY